MNFTFENQGTNTYLTYAVNANDSVDTMSLGMLTNNKIPGLAATIFTQMDNVKYIKYNVSAKVSVKQFFNGPVNKKRLVGVFSGIVDAMLSAEEYMIDCNSILLDLEYIFADVSSCETVLICLPIESVDSGKIDLGMFFKNIMFTTQFDQTENCDHVAKIINYLNNFPVFSLLGFKEVLHEINSADNSTAVQNVIINRNISANTENSENKKSEETKKVPVAKTNLTVNQPTTTSVISQTPVLKNDEVKNLNYINNINVPVKSNDNSTDTKKSKKKAKEKKADKKQEKKMSMFYLLQHYNKENAEIYKAQKAAEKKSEEKPHEKKEESISSAPDFSFEIPGQAAKSVNMFSATEVKRNTAEKIEEKRPAKVDIQEVKISEIKQTTVPSSTNTMNFGETTVLGSGMIGETTVLNNANAQIKQEPLPHLVRKKNNEKISINKPIFRIGKERSYVDYFIGDNTAISRSHANIIIREKRYFITDTNSTNHTYIDEKMIPSNAEIEIYNGSKIRLANEEFEFILM